MPMTKEEKIETRLNKARLLSQQGRWAEARLEYENIISDIRGIPRQGQKVRGVHET